MALALAAVLAGPAAGQEDAADSLAPPADASKLPSGALSKVLTAGTGESYPSDRHLIAMHFVGWSQQGDKLYSSYDVGKPMIVTLNSVYPPWREALERMVTGEKRRIWLPAHLVAAGQRGPSGASIFDLELGALKSIPSPPDDLEQPPAGAVKTPSGAFTELVEAGSGSERPAADNLVLVHYIGWTADGRSFDSSFTRGRPTAFLLDQVMPAFAETVQTMVVKEKRRVWVPGPVASGNWTGKPKGPLVFEIELVRILPREALDEAQQQAAPQAPKPPARPGAA